MILLALILAGAYAIELPPQGAGGEGGGAGVVCVWSWGFAGPSLVDFGRLLHISVPAIDAMQFSHEQLKKLSCRSPVFSPRFDTHRRRSKCALLVKGERVAGMGSILEL